MSGFLNLPGLAQSWTYTYEERFNQVKTQTDPLGHVTTYVCDYEEGLGEAGHLIRIEHLSVEDESGKVCTPIERFTYNSFGLKETETDARRVVTGYEHAHGTPDEAYRQPGALFAQGATPVPGLFTRLIRDEGGLNETITHKEFDAAGNPRVVLGPGWVGRGRACCGGGGGSRQGAGGTVTRHTCDA